MIETTNTTVYTWAEIVAHYEKLIDEDCRKLNEFNSSQYLRVIPDNWRKNNDAGIPYSIPDPPKAFKRIVGAQGFPVMVEGSEPVCAKFVPPTPAQPAELPRGIPYPVQLLNGEWYPHPQFDTAYDGQIFPTPDGKIYKKREAPLWGGTPGKPIMMKWYERQS